MPLHKVDEFTVSAIFNYHISTFFSYCTVDVSDSVVRALRADIMANGGNNANQEDIALFFATARTLKFFPKASPQTILYEWVRYWGERSELAAQHNKNKIFAEQPVKKPMSDQEKKELRKMLDNFLADEIEPKNANAEKTKVSKSLAAAKRERMDFKYWESKAKDAILKYLRSDESKEFDKFIVEFALDSGVEGLMYEKKGSDYFLTKLYRDWMYKLLEDIAQSK